MTPIKPTDLPELMGLSYRVMDATHQLLLDHEQYVQQRIETIRAEEAEQKQLAETLRAIGAARSHRIVAWVAQRANFLRPALGMLCIMGCAMIAASIIYAQTDAQVVVVDETMLFSWKVLAMAIVGACGYGGVLWSVSAHHKNETIHLTMADLDERYTRKEMCQVQHAALVRELGTINLGIAEIKRDMPKGQ